LKENQVVTEENLRLRILRKSLKLIHQ